MNKSTIILTFCLAASSLAAQIDPGVAKIRVLLEKVESGMQDVDKLLLQSASKANAAAAKDAAGATAKRLDELMKQLQSSQDSIGKDMQKLIEEIERMRQQQQQQQQQQQDGDPQQRQNRPKPDEEPQDQQRGQQQDQVPTPDMVRQNDPEQQKQRQQQQQKQQQQKGQPNGPEKDKDKGQQLPGEKPPPGDEERTPHVEDNQRWGVLPKYLEFMHSRGGMPEVPEKYRRYYEAFLKSDLGKPETKSPAGEKR